VFGSKNRAKHECRERGGSWMVTKREKPERERENVTNASIKS
jgi:hypothetical protein